MAVRKMNESAGSPYTCTVAQILNVMYVEYVELYEKFDILGDSEPVYAGYVNKVPREYWNVELDRNRVHIIEDKRDAILIYLD